MIPVFVLVRRRIALVAILLIVAVPVLRAQCVGPNPPCTEFWKASTVFVGTVQSITSISTSDELMRTNRVRLTVDEAFKGTDGPTLDLLTGVDSEATEFQVGERYFVYAFLDKKTGLLGDSGCSLTKLLDNASEDIEYARNAAAGRTSGEIFGELSHWEPETKTKNRFERALAGASISLKADDGVVLTTTADDDGNYSFSGLLAGRYTMIAPSLPGTYQIPERDAKIDVTDPRACVNVNFQYHWDGQVRGRVVTSGGEPVAGWPVALANGDDYGGYENQRARTNADGEFEMIHLPPGHYTFGDDVVESKSVRGFRIGSRTVDLTIGNGERVRLADFALKADVAPAEIEGKVVGADGEPVADAQVYVSAQGVNDPLYEPFVRTDASGSFKAGVIQGRTYRIVVEKSEPQPATGLLKAQTTVTIVGNPFPLRITLSRR